MIVGSNYQSSIKTESQNVTTRIADEGLRARPCSNSQQIQELDFFAHIVQEKVPMLSRKIEAIKKLQGNEVLSHLQMICSFVESNARLWQNAPHDVHVKKQEHNLVRGLDWNAGMSQLFIKKIAYIGKGGQRHYYLWQNYDTGSLVAVGSLKREYRENSRIDLKEQVAREVAIFEKIGDSPYVVRLFGAVKKNNDIKLIQEYCPEGDLDAYLEKTVELEMGDFFQIVYDLLRGLAFLHGKNIIHRDVKAANIFLTKENGRLHAKFADFGYALDLSRQDNTYRLNGSIGYMSPFLWVSQPSSYSNMYQKFGKHADVWALGIVVYQMFFGNDPSWMSMDGPKSFTDKAIYAKEVQKQCERVVQDLKSADSHNEEECWKIQHFIGVMLHCSQSNFFEAKTCLELFERMFPQIVAELV